MIAIIASALGIIGTLVAWKFNPRRVIYSELDAIYKRLDGLYGERDKALAENDSDTLTRVTADIIGLCQRKNTLLQRLG